MHNSVSARNKDNKINDTFVITFLKNVSENFEQKFRKCWRKKSENQTKKIWKSDKKFDVHKCVLQVTQASKVWGEVPLPEDLEGAATLKVSHSLMDDDEDFAADEASGGEGLNHSSRNPCSAWTENSDILNLSQHRIHALQEEFRADLVFFLLHNWTQHVVCFSPACISHENYKYFLCFLPRPPQWRGWRQHPVAPRLREHK